MGQITGSNFFSAIGLLSPWFLSSSSCFCRSYFFASFTKKSSVSLPKKKKGHRSPSSCKSYRLWAYFSLQTNTKLKKNGQMQAGNERQIWPFPPSVPGTGAWLDGHGSQQQVIWRGRRGRWPWAWNCKWFGCKSKGADDLAYSLVLYSACLQ